MNRADGWLLLLLGLTMLVGMGVGYAATKEAQGPVEDAAFERGRAKGYAEAMEWLMAPDPACGPAKRKVPGSLPGDIIIHPEAL